MGTVLLMSFSGTLVLIFIFIFIFISKFGTDDTY